MDKTTLSDQLKNLFESLDPNKDGNQIVYDLFDDNSGNRIGYQTQSPTGVTNVFDNNGNRIGYSPAPNPFGGR
mgnify:CR=1 FL=1